MRTVITSFLLVVMLCLACTQRIARVSVPPNEVSRATNEAATLLAASPCGNAIAQDAVCNAANTRALELMNQDKLEAITVVQNVNSGALLVFAASQPDKLDVTTAVLPLSLTKVFLTASWYDNKQPEVSFESSRGTANASNPAYRSSVSIHEMLVGGSDSAGRQMSSALRKAVGSEVVIKDFERYGFASHGSAMVDKEFWGELAPAWKARLVPAAAYNKLSTTTKGAEWEDTLSIGEANFAVTALHISRFMQAVGAAGMMRTPIAREEVAARSDSAPVSRNISSWRAMEESTALRIQPAMLDAVSSGTAKSIAQSLDGTGWKIGGKTGSGPGPVPIGPQSDGWFAGLIFDQKGKAQFTVATFVRHGGPGGTNAAKLSAELARFIIRGDR